MPAVAPLPPEAIRELLETHGYQLTREDEYNWAFTKAADDEPIIVPRTVDLVPLEIAFHVARKVGFNNYFGQVESLDASPDKSVH